MSHGDPAAPVSKSKRITEFFRRLADLPPQPDQPVARSALEATLNAVEDELSGVPFDPSHWRTDGRMYPVQDDNAANVAGNSGVLALRSRAHETYLGLNGAIEIKETTTDTVVFTKPGSNGKGVWE